SSHTCPVCFTETCCQARVIGNSLPEGFAKIPECLEGFPLQLSADLAWDLPCTSMGSLSHPPDISDRRPPPVTAPGEFLSSVAVLVPVMAGRFSPSAPRTEVSVSYACRLHPVRPPTPTR